MRKMKNLHGSPTCHHGLKFRRIFCCTWRSRFERDFKGYDSASFEKELNILL
jgi:hypothetical protein